MLSMRRASAALLRVGRWAGGLSGGLGAVAAAGASLRAAGPGSLSARAAPWGSTVLLPRGITTSAAAPRRLWPLDRPMSMPEAASPAPEPLPQAINDGPGPPLDRKPLYGEPGYVYICGPGACTCTTFLIHLDARPPSDSRVQLGRRLSRAEAEAQKAALEAVREMPVTLCISEDWHHADKETWPEELVNWYMSIKTPTDARRVAAALRKHYDADPELLAAARWLDDSAAAGATFTFKFKYHDAYALRHKNF